MPGPSILERLLNDPEQEDELNEADEDSFLSLSMVTDVGQHKIVPMEEEEVEVKPIVVARQWQRFLPDGRIDDYVDVTMNANWAVSSVREQRGAASLLNDDLSDYWESEGHRPHFLYCEFAEITDVIGFLIYFDHKEDDSFTPRKIICQMSYDINYFSKGNSFVFNYSQPQGWIYNSLHKHGRFTTPTSCWAIRFVISDMHDGRNTRIRCIKVLAQSASAKRRFEKMENKENSPLFAHSTIETYMTLR
ncbi:hypothetical protein QR680_011573 [Steinernema hermaphroditum]|uniref:Anaphase-promoting complex subunit 10 n=1 Tax=Steinernema hermaphroditum TaxID=289476 RepID=A0AA39HYX8_9BILA|nr:hypothetical protein QR680_011573 [Steinernema hermaphroditum]